MEEMTVVSSAFGSCRVESIVSLQFTSALLVFLDNAGEPGFRVGISFGELV